MVEPVVMGAVSSGGEAVAPTPGAANALRAYSPAQQALMDPGLREIAAAGATLPLMDYLAAVKEREQLGVRMKIGRAHV